MQASILIVSHNRKSDLQKSLSILETQIKKKINLFSYFYKIKIFVKLFSDKGFNRMFLKWKGLPPEMIKNY